MFANFATGSGVSNTDALSPPSLAAQIKQLGLARGFQQVGIADLDLRAASERLQAWLAKGFHGEMDYMQKHGSKRWQPAELVPGTASVISVRMDYFPPDSAEAESVLNDTELAYVSRYALGRDYHKVLRNRLQAFADDIGHLIGKFGYRVFVDSAPVLEKPLAESAGVGWIGKHTNLINSQAGSWFFLGEIYTDLELPPDTRATEHCGTCTRCIRACPTGAIVAPFELDARLCISYLTIELDTAIPESLRPMLGNRIYGCDDCQLVCPWNKFAKLSAEADFRARHRLDCASLLELFAWSEDEFLRYTEGSAIRRIGHRRWLRNIAVAIGNAARAELDAEPYQTALQARISTTDDAMLLEHYHWASARWNAAPSAPQRLPALFFNSRPGDTDE
jgi:epoxyqueuosine reductase